MRANSRSGGCVNWDVVGFRFQERSMAPLDVAAVQWDAVFDAIRELMKLINARDNQINCHLAPREAMLFDDHRCRTGFTGLRHLELCYVNRDTFISEMPVLERELEREGPYLRIGGEALA